MTILCRNYKATLIWFTLYDHDKNQKLDLFRPNFRLDDSRTNSHYKRIKKKKCGSRLNCMETSNSGNEKKNTKRDYYSRVYSCKRFDYLLI